MKYAVCAVFDSAVGAFMRPVFTQSVGQMVRSFSDEVNRKAEENVMNNHPDHFSLFHLGVFDDESGRFELFDSPARVSRASEVLIQS